jgi:hypothetical protein
VQLTDMQASDQRGNRYAAPAFGSQLRPARVVRSVARKTPNAALLLPCYRPIPQHLCEPQSLRLAPIENRFDDVGRQAGEREELQT